MKNTVLVIISAILGVLTLMIVMAIYGRMNRSMELKSNLSSAVEETMENMAVNPKYTVHNTNEFLADLVGSLSCLLDTDSDITVDIQQCDKEKGILSIKVTLAYLHPNGKEGTVTYEKTVIINKLLEDAPEKYRVGFYVGADLYKEYIVMEGSVHGAPAEPQSEGLVFYGWIDENGYLADFSQPVTRDLAYYADMR